MYTSPHLRFVRERIQINNTPLSEDQFAKYFFETWNRLEASARDEGHPNPEATETKPVYFRFLTLMALHAYISEGIDVAVIECGIGGEYDSTNILVNPSVCGVTSLGIDHTAMLGDTIDSIAWHKAGIFKPSVPAFAAAQPEEAIKVLKDRAQERETDLHIVPVHHSLANGDVKLGLAADFQKTNASLAIAIASSHLQRLRLPNIPDPTDSSSILPSQFRAGLEQVQLGGRCEVRRDTKTNLTWHIDGGHTLESIEMAGRWFASLISSSASSSTTRTPRVLIFNQQTRDADSLAKKLHTTLTTALQPTLASSSSSTPQSPQPFTHVLFCTNQTYVSSGYKADLASINTNAADVEALSVQNALADTWRAIDPSADVAVVKTVEEAVRNARHVAELHNSGTDAEESDVMVLVTGSLHLVGGVVEVLETEKENEGVA